MKFVVNVGYKQFDFSDCTDAVNFALIAASNQRNEEDEVTIEFVKEEK